MARLFTGNREDALEVVQEAMLQLARRYAGRNEGEWGALFYRILQSRLRDWHRRTTLRRRFRVWLGRGDEVPHTDPLANVADPADSDPAAGAARRRALQALEAALARLPRRQQQAFLLRAWEGLDVAQTARAMNCSEGSVKTHYARALEALRTALKDHWP